MRIIGDAVYSNIYNAGLGVYRFDGIRFHHKILLLSISKRQRKAFKNYEKIPWQVLRIWYDNGFLPFEIRCDRMITVRRILYLIEHGTYRDKNHSEHGSWLYDRIVEEVFMPKKSRLPNKKSKGGSEKFIGVGKKKVPQFYVREQLGTVIR